MLFNVVLLLAQTLYSIFKPDSSAELKADEHESLSAYFTAAKFNNPKTDYSLDDLKKVSVESSYTIDFLFNKATKVWIKSSILHAEKLHRHFRNVRKRC